MSIYGTSFPDTVKTALADGYTVDAFGRGRVSGPTTIFDSINQYNTAPFLWENVTTGGGTLTHLPNESTANLHVVTASGDKVIRQTHQYFRYQPGHSQLVFLTSRMGAIKANVRQRLGYFDASNGLFFEQDGTNLRVVQRSFTSGSAVDTAVNQSAWNLDKLNGTGPSHIVLDTSKSQIFVIDFQWLGVGRVRMGFNLNGINTYCHEFLNANALLIPYMTTANLPLRFELENTGVSGNATDMTQICATVISEGGLEADRGLPFAAGNGVTAITVSTRVPLVSIRPKLTFNSLVNRGQIFQQKLAVRCVTNDLFYEIVYGGLPSRISLTNASFNSVNANSIVEFDVAATAISGGTVIDSGYAAGGGGGPGGVGGEAFVDLNTRVGLALDIAGSVADILSIVGTALSGSAPSTAALRWTELF